MDGGQDCKQRNLLVQVHNEKFEGIEVGFEKKEYKVCSLRNLCG